MASLSLPPAEQLLRWRAQVVSAALAVGSIVVIGLATATDDHNVWIFFLWVLLTLGAIVTGAAVLARIPRSRGQMGVRRMASFGVVMALLCATFGLAIYSNTRTHDCPTTGVCTPATPGKGQIQQQP
jgi:hypothetical protein